MTNTWVEWFRGRNEEDRHSYDFTESHPGMEDVVVLGRYCGRVHLHHPDFLDGIGEISGF